MAKLSIDLLHDEPDRLVQLLYIAIDTIERVDSETYESNRLWFENLLGNADYIIERVKDSARRSDDYFVTGDMIQRVPVT